MIKLILTLTLFLTTNSYASGLDNIQDINQFVHQLNKERDNYDSLNLTIDTIQLEGVPPKIKYLFSPSSKEPVLAEIQVGKETYLITYQYYIKDEQVIKYTKEITGRPDNPPKQAIIYDTKKNIIWKNIDSPIVSNKDVLDLYQNLIAKVSAFAQ